jgi:trimethylamine--corrinoid protein Co-methyltransferase
MQTEYVYPELGDRTSPKEWLEIGKPNLIKNAIKKKNDILKNPSAAEFSPELDAKIRKMFNIHLN